MPQTVRLLIDRPEDGAWNMAVDETLLDAAASGIATLRFYQWSPATLSLGYFQAWNDRAFCPTAAGCPVVRRSTGGGAILHHHELTYSLAIPLVGGATAAKARAYYRHVHESLIEIFSEQYEFAARLFGEHRCNEEAENETSIKNTTEAGSSADPFLCFLRRSSEDIVTDSSDKMLAPTGNVKIVGSAQRRRQEAILQHGSILLARSPHAPELPGILEMTGVSIDPLELAKLLADQLSNRLGWQYQPHSLSCAATDEVELIARQRYLSTRWNERR